MVDGVHAVENITQYNVKNARLKQSLEVAQQFYVILDISYATVHKTRESANDWSNIALFPSPLQLYACINS